MVLFLIALIAAALGVGAYAYYNPGVHDVTLHTYRFTAVPDWMPVAVAAGVTLFLFLLHAVYTSVLIRTLRRANQRPRPLGASHPVQAANR
jgi:hypothetical protein